jgi:hypothetical protein
MAFPRILENVLSHLFIATLDTNFVVSVEIAAHFIL